MKTGQKRMRESKIQECVQLRLAGHSFYAIARILGRHHTTIMYHCQKARLPKKRTKRLPNKLKQKPKTQLIKDDDKIINLGKSYEDYAAEEKARNWKKRSDIASI